MIHQSDFIELVDFDDLQPRDKIIVIGDPSVKIGKGQFRNCVEWTVDQVHQDGSTKCHNPFVKDQIIWGDEFNRFIKIK